MTKWLLVLAACGQPVAKPQPPPVVAAMPVDAAGPTQEETLAAIQKAMNDLKPAAQQCWAKIATERFDIEGEYDAQIDIAEPVTVTAVTDTTRSARLIACMRDVLVHYPWAPPLHGQTIRLPFKWRAPDGQNVIDRNLIDRAAQGKIEVAVLLDENNTGNAAASMFEVGIPAGTSTGMRRPDRAELWWLQSWKADELNELSVEVGKEKLVAGDMIYVPAGAARDIKVVSGTLRAVVVMAPGGREGAGRTGALPTPEGTGKPPVILRARDMKTTGIATIFLDSTSPLKPPFAASIIHFAADAKVPAHVHAHETEMLYAFSHFGAETSVGTLTVAGVAQDVTDHSVVQIPANTEHAFAAKAESFGLQIYTPGGPEQRFKK